MTTTNPVETVDGRLARLLERRSELETQRDQLANELQQLEAEHDRAVLDGADPTELGTKRRALLGDVEATDRAVSILDGPIAAAREEILAREQWAALVKLRKDIPQADAEARQRAAELGPQVEQVAEQIAAAVRKVIDLVAAHNADGNRVAGMWLSEHGLASILGEEPQYEDRHSHHIAGGANVRGDLMPVDFQQHVVWSTGGPDMPRQRLLFAVHRGPDDVLTELVEIARGYLDGARRG